jgi:hypothetical protein
VGSLNTESGADIPWLVAFHINKQQEIADRIATSSGQRGYTQYPGLAPAHGNRSASRCVYPAARSKDRKEGALEKSFLLLWAEVASCSSSSAEVNSIPQ